MAGIDKNIQHKDGKYKKGCSGNPSGRRDSSKFIKILDDLFPDDLLSFMLLAKLNGMNTNTKDVKNIINLIERPEMKKKFRKYLNKMKINGKISYKAGWGKLTDKEQTDVIFKLMDRKHGTPTQQIKTEISTPEPININVNFVKIKK